MRALALVLVLSPTPSAAQTPPVSPTSITEKPPVGPAVQKERERLAGYRWRLSTEMRVDGVTRLKKLDDVNLAPDGSLVKKTVRFDRSPPPTPVPDNDPRRHTVKPPSDEEDDRLFESAEAVMDLYARLSPEQLDRWASSAELQPPDPGRPGLARLHGRGLARPQDDAVLYLAAGKKPIEIEIKTTVDPRILDIAFLRISFDEVESARAGVPPLVVPKTIFLNMDRGRRHVTLQMETSDYRTWQ